MRKGTIALVVVVAFIFAVTAAFAAKAPDVVTLKGATKGPVELSHKKHAETMKIACKECHHTMKSPSEPVKKCDACHKADAKPGAKPMSLKDAFHTNCWKGCHVKEKQAGKKAPTMCNECHKGK